MALSVAKLMEMAWSRRGLVEGVGLESRLAGRHEGGRMGQRRGVGGLSFCGKML